MGHFLTVLRAHKRLKLKIEAFSFTDIATMPPLRRRSEPTNSTPAVNGDNIASLRQKCAEKGLPTHGRRHVLVSRLQQHAESQAEANSRQSPEARNIQPSPSESVFSATQLTQIQSLVSRSVEQAIAEISSNAARTAIEAMTNTIPQRQHSQPTTQSETASTNVAVPSVEIQMECSVPPSTTTAPYANGFNEVPAQFVKQIQSGEFFDLAKLLPKHASVQHSEESMILTLENSVIKAKKAPNSFAKITDIEQWTTAFTIYMSVFTHQFPSRAQELLQYMTLIRHAAQTHRGLGWRIYDHKFRRKAALNLTLDWSVIDQQLWLMIFTTCPETLSQSYPLFSNGPQSRVSSGGERGGFCNEFN